MDARRPVGRPSWAPGGPSGGRLGRQEARRQAVWAARSPESSVLPTVPAKSSVLRSRQAGRRRQAGCPRLAKLQTRKPELDNFCIDCVFYSEFAWVAFLRQVQREQISEHRHTQNYKKTCAKTAPATCQQITNITSILAPQNGAKSPSKSLPEACRRPLAPQDAPKTQPRAAKRDQKDPKSEPRALQERREAIFRATTFPDGGSPGLGPDRRGGVGEGL